MGLMIDDTLTWIDHIDQLISRFDSACYTIRAVRAMYTRKALRMLYCPYGYSTILYDIIILVNTNNSIKIFRMHKKFKNYN